MMIFIDSADIAEIKEALKMGMVDGVTTNPTLIAKTGKPSRAVLETICSMVEGPVSAEVIATTAREMVEEGQELAKIAKNITIKVPLTKDGLKATKALSELGLKTNLTLCFSALQAWLAAKAGATYISPFVGRLDDIGSDGMHLVKDILEIYGNYSFETKVLVASIRSPIHVLRSAKMGADVATIPFSVISRLVGHPLTESGLARFLADWKKVPAP